MEWRPPRGWTLLALILAGCLPGDEDKRARCVGTEVFDAVTRSCSPGESILRIRTRSLDEDTPITLRLDEHEGDFDACEILPGSASENLTRLSPLTPPSCSCSGGSCSLSLWPREDAFGAAGLVYRLRDVNEGYTDYYSLDVVIRDRNDAPVLSPLNFSLALREDNDSNSPQDWASRAAGHSFNLCEDLAGLTLTDPDSVKATTLEIVTAPGLGSLSCNGCNCIEAPSDCSCSFTAEEANDNGTPYTSFAIRFRDTPANDSDNPLRSSTATVTVNVTPVNDRPDSRAPVDLTATPLTEDTPGILSLLALEDGDHMALTYEVADEANCGQGDPCTHTLEALRQNHGVLHGCLNLDAQGEEVAAGAQLTCNFTPHLNEHAESIVFYYRAQDPDGATSDWVRVSFRLDSRDDVPVPFFAFYRVRESPTAWAQDAGPYTFDLASTVGEALDADNEDLENPASPVTSYTLLSHPPGASFDNCMAANRDLLCDFVLDDNNGNLNTPLTPAKAQATLGTLTVEARQEGSAGNLIALRTVAESSNVRARHQRAPADYGASCLSATGTYGDCREYFNRMVQVEANGSGGIDIAVFLQSTHQVTTDTQVERLLNNHPMASRFVSASGSTGAQALAATATLSGGQDGQSGFRAEYRVEGQGAQNASPNGLITVQIVPINDTPVFCRYSSYREAPECGPRGCLGVRSPSTRGLTPASHRENRPVYYYDTAKATCYRSTGTGANDWAISYYDCPYSTDHSDCGGGNCRAQGSPVGSVTPASHTSSGPLIYQDSLSLACYRSTGRTAEDWALMSASMPTIEVNEGEVIRIERMLFDEGGGDTLENAQRIFLSRFFVENTTLFDPDAVQWHQILDGRSFPCPFSRGACDSGRHCRQRETGYSNPTGQVVPTNHTQTRPLFYWANEENSGMCYRSTGTGSSDWMALVDNTVLDARQSYNPVADTFDLDSGGRLALGNTAGSEDDDALELVLVPTSSMSGQSIVSFNLDDGSCQYTDNCAGSDCRGSGPPSGSVTPAEHRDSNPVVYEDTGSNRCYISTGLENTNWRQVDAWPMTTVYFKVIVVHPVGAIHHGWKALNAQGPVVNKYGEVLSQDNASFCPYSKTACDGGHPCRGVAPPGGSPFSAPRVVADGDLAIYKDEEAGKCYVWDPELDETNKWRALDNYCHLTDSELAPECYNDSCLFDAGQTLPTALRPTAVGRGYAFYDRQRDRFACYRSYGTGTGELESYEGVGSVDIRWRPFTVSGVGRISGYNIYRRGAQEEFGEVPLNEAPLLSSVGGFIDNGPTSPAPPFPGTVYYYEVRPIVEGIESRGVGSYTTARVFVPPSNMAFVHRRIVNRRMCTLMGRPVEASGHNRCAYTGLGDNASGYYDLGQDFLVPLFEAGCPYTVGQASCDTLDGNCIADRGPNDSGDGDNGDFFYNRANGLCYWKNPSTSRWGEFSSELTSILTTYSDTDDNTQEVLRAHRPPLSFLSQSGAISLCSDDSLDQRDMVVGCPFSISGCDTADNRCTGTDDPDTGGGNYRAQRAGVFFWNSEERLCWEANSTAAGDWTLLGGDGPVNPNRFPMRIPTRKEQVAFSFWDEDLSHSAITLRERGHLSEAGVGCNASDAQGVTSGYLDVEAPLSANLYSLPGTASSGIRSMATGVSQTRECRSLFGIRDMVGNVTEWSSDQVRCELPFRCVFNETNKDFTIQSPRARISSLFNWDCVDGDNDGQCDSGAGGFVFGHYDGDGDGLLEDWATDGYPMGPCVDADGDNTCDSSLDSWRIADRKYGAGLFIAPLGLVAHSNFPSRYEDDPAVSSLVRIGSSSLTSASLHEDSLEVNTSYAYCPYNRADGDCSGEDCTTEETGHGSPHGNITPSGHSAADPVYFYNGNNGQCYRSSGTGNTNWQLVGCHYTESGATNPTPSEHTDVSPLVFYNTAADNCAVSTGTGASDWRSYGASNVVLPPQAGLAHGGGYLSGTGAGQFHLEFVDYKTAPLRSDVGLRCVMPIPNAFYTE